MVRRGANHPSVFMWSIGNEIIVVDAAAAQLVGLAVQPQSVDRINLDLADTERSGHPVESLAF
jgi:hypothetical protein